MYGETCARCEFQLVGRDVPAGVRPEDADHPDRADPAGLDRGLGRHRRARDSDAASRSRDGRSPRRRRRPSRPRRPGCSSSASRRGRACRPGPPPRPGVDGSARASRHDGVDVGPGEELVLAECLDAELSATSPARRPPLIATSVASGTWRAMTRAQVSPMNPEPRTPNRTGSATGQPLPVGAATTGVTSVPRSPMVPVHHVARLEVDAGRVAGPVERAAGDDIARLEGHPAGGERDDLLRAEDHVRGRAVLPGLAVDLEGHLEVVRIGLHGVGRRDVRAPRREAVAPLAVQPVEEVVEATRRRGPRRPTASSAPRCR